MENNSTKIALGYAKRIEEAKEKKVKEEATLDTVYKFGLLRVSGRKYQKTAKMTDAKEEAAVKLQCARERAGLCYQVESRRKDILRAFEKKTLEVFKADRRRLADYRENYLHVQKISKAFENYPLWAEAECDPGCIEAPDVRKAMVEAFGVEDSDVLRFPMELGSDAASFWLDGEDPDQEIAFSHHILRSFLSFIPAGKLKVCVYDEQEMGLRIKPFLDFRNMTNDVIDIYSRPDELHNVLEELESQLSDTLLNKLGSSYEDIFAYNRASAGRSEKITLLLLYDFPGNLDKKCTAFLQRILKNGSKCGIYAVICHRPDIRSTAYDAPGEEEIKQLSGYCRRISYKKDGVWLLPDGIKLYITPSPAQDEMNKFFREYSEECEQMMYRGLSFEETCAPEEDEWFDSSSAEGLRIPLGVGTAGESQNLVIGRQGYHGLIIGGTGSGKSTLLHTIIISSMLHYSPDELQLYLMDFKSGTEFKPYERYRLPHIRLLALDAIQEFGESILEELDKEIRVRAERFKEVGVSSLKDYRSKSDEPMPRILVLIDEFQVLFNMDQNRKVADHCAQLTSNIVKQGRSFGIHLLMSTQSMRFGNLTIGNECFGEMRIRIGLNWADQDTLSLFGRDSGKDVERLHRLKEGPKGTAVMTEEMGNKEEESFRVSLCEDKDSYLGRLEEELKDYKDERHVFDGQSEYPLLDALDKYDEIHDKENVSVLLGEKIKIAPPLVLKLHQGDNQNLLICGQEAGMERRITADYLISLVRNGDTNVRLIDGEMVCGRAKDETRAFYELLKSKDGRLEIAQNQGDIIRYIREAYGIFKERKASDSDEAFVVFIRNLQFLELLRNILSGETVDESAYVDDGGSSAGMSIQSQMEALMNGEADSIEDPVDHSDNTPAGEMLYKMMRDGSSYGIYFVVSSRDYATVKDCGSYADNLLKHFRKRILFAISDDDAASLIEGVKISGLMTDTVYYTDGLMDKLQYKPYKEPEFDELKDYLNAGKEND